MEHWSACPFRPEKRLFHSLISPLFFIQYDRRGSWCLTNKRLLYTKPTRGSKRESRRGTDKPCRRPNTTEAGFCGRKETVVVCCFLKFFYRCCGRISDETKGIGYTSAFLWQVTQALFLSSASSSRPLRVYKLPPRGSWIVRAPPHTPRGARLRGWWSASGGDEPGSYPADREPFSSHLPRRQRWSE